MNELIAYYGQRIILGLLIFTLFVLVGCATTLTAAQRDIAREKGVSDEEMLELVKEDNKRKCSVRKYTALSECLVTPRKSKPCTTYLICEGSSTRIKSAQKVRNCRCSANRL